MVSLAKTTVRSADTHLADAARRVLEPRLASVVKLLGRAARKSHQDVEHIHRLRVSARRTLAALKVFADVLPEKERHWWRKQVRRMRQAAGEARDQDVLTALLKDRAKGQPDADWQGLLEEVARQRKQFQKPIVRLYQKLRHRLPRKARRLLSKIAGHRHSPTLAAAAHQQLAPCVQQVVGDQRERLDDDAALHRLRIRVKQLRYTLEILAGAWTAERSRGIVKGAQSSVEKLQKILGDHNDHVAIIQRLEAWREESKAGAARLLESLIDVEHQALIASRRQILAQWTEEERRRLAGEFAALLGPEARLVS